MLMLSGEALSYYLLDMHWKVGLCLLIMIMDINYQINFVMSLIVNAYNLCLYDIKLC